jgi:hypothetical protein
MATMYKYVRKIIEVGLIKHKYWQAGTKHEILVHV